MLKDNLVHMESEKMKKNIPKKKNAAARTRFIPMWKIKNNFCTRLIRCRTFLVYET